MKTIQQLDLQILQKNLGQLDPKTLAGIPGTELEWILSDFLLSWGQSLPLYPVGWPPEAQRDELRRFGLTVWPFSTAADFPAVNPDQLNILAAGLASLNLYVMLLDPIIDEPLNVPNAAKLAIQPVLTHFHHTLSLLFPAASPFWGEIEKQLNTMSQTMLEESHRSSGSIRPFTWEEFEHIAIGKMAFARINCIALATLNGAPEQIPALVKCWDAISLASIVNDDTLDWRDDYKNANYTYLLSQILYSPPFREQTESGQMPELSEIGAALFCTDLIETFNKQAHAELVLAAHRAEMINCPSLAHLIRRVQAKISPRFMKVFDHKLMAVITAASNNA